MTSACSCPLINAPIKSTLDECNLTKSIVFYHKMSPVKSFKNEIYNEVNFI